MLLLWLLLLTIVINFCACLCLSCHLLLPLPLPIINSHPDLLSLSLSLSRFFGCPCFSINTTHNTVSTEPWPKDATLYHTNEGKDHLAVACPCVFVTSGLKSFLLNSSLSFSFKYSLHPLHPVTPFTLGSICNFYFLLFSSPSSSPSFTMTTAVCVTFSPLTLLLKHSDPLLAEKAKLDTALGRRRRRNRFRQFFKLSLSPLLVSLTGKNVKLKAKMQFTLKCDLTSNLCRVLIGL